jgi:hypothetical protein
MRYRIPGSRNTFGPIPSLEQRKMVATVVHRAVCQVIGPEAAARETLYYPVVGAAIAGQLTRDRYEICAGIVRLRPHADAPWYQLAAAPEAPAPHVWLVRHHASGKVELVDLTSRYFGGWLESLGATWQRQRAIPWHLWEWQEEIPRYIRFDRDVSATEQVQEQVFERQRILMRPAITTALALLE